MFNYVNNISQHPLTYKYLESDFGCRLLPVGAVVKLGKIRFYSIEVKHLSSLIPTPRFSDPLGATTPIKREPGWGAMTKVPPTNYQTFSTINCIHTV
jgi:hypothetical protein